MVKHDVIFAEYLFGRLRLGYDYLSVFLASALFEQVINRKLERQDFKRFCNVSQETDIDLAKKINLLNDQSLREDAICKFGVFGVQYMDRIKDKLHQYRILRNELMHANESIDRLLLSETRKAAIIELVCYLVAELNPDFFEQRVANTVGGKLKNILHGMSEVEADYLIREIDETMVRRYDRSLTKDKNRAYFQSIELSDFDNLFEMRKKLVFMKHDLRRWFARNSDIPSRHVKIPVISTIDTTSGYVWMPIVYDFKKHKEVERSNIELPSASIMATPLDFRVYIDFGGKSINSRLRFLDFIENDTSFNEFIYELPSCDQDNFCFFDVKWYSSITRHVPLSEVIRNETSLPPMIADARKDLVNATEIQTSSRLLCGFIFEREFVEKHGLAKPELFRHVGLVLDLYYRFLLYEL